MPDKSAFAGSRESPPEPWRSFLKKLDQLVKERIDLHCVGGFSVTLQFGLSRNTADMDILPVTPSQLLAELVRLAGQDSELHRSFKVYLHPVTVATYPEDYESRLERMWPNFKLEHLRLFSLEAHDLALTKLERNSEKDRQDIEGLARAGKLDPTILRDRYVKELRPNLLSHFERHDLTMGLWVESIQEILAQ
jgi:uncharacterized nucleotidyltransferase DUF6036